MSRQQQQQYAIPQGRGGRVVAEASQPEDEYDITLVGFLWRVIRWTAFLSVIFFLWFHFNCPTAAQLKKRGAISSLDHVCVSFHSEAAPIYNSVYYRSFVRHTNQISKKLDEIEAYRTARLAVADSFKTPVAVSAIEAYKTGVNVIADNVAVAVANAEPLVRSIAQSNAYESVIRAGKGALASAREALLPIYHHESYKAARVYIDEAAKAIETSYKVGLKIWKKNVKPQILQTYKQVSDVVGQALHQIFVVVDGQLETLLAPAAAK